MADEQKREFERAQEAIRRSMEAGGTAPPPGTRTVQSPTGQLPIEERAERARTPVATGSITQSLADAHAVVAQLEDRLFGGGVASPAAGASVQDSLRAHVERLTGLLARL